MPRLVPRQDQPRPVHSAGSKARPVETFTRFEVTVDDLGGLIVKPTFGVTARSKEEAVEKARERMLPFKPDIVSVFGVGLRQR